MKQIKLFPTATSTQFGGSLAKSRRKNARVLTRRKPMHFTLKAARFIQHEARWIEGLLEKFAEKFGLRLYTYGVNRDHLQVTVLLPDRTLYRKFIRAFTGGLARKMGKGLWKEIPHSRIVEWGKDFQQAIRYVLVNRLESFGLVVRIDRIPYWKTSRERLLL